jgi:V/A-type H+/Na+-transporting ATPase subunit E
MTEKEQSSGVQELIDRLRENGVEAGNEEAGQIVGAARKQAASILDNAKQEAAELVSKAREEAQNLRKAGEDALRLAGRDAVLQLQEELSQKFAEQVTRIVGASLDDADFIQKLLIEVAGQAVPKESGRQVQLLVSDEAAMNRFAAASAASLMRDGVKLAVSPSGEPGVTVKMLDDNTEVGFEEKAITDFLLQHLLPRFRAVLEGDA